MKYRKLRIAWSVAWGVVAVLVCVLWVRSYYWYDFTQGPAGITSASGSLYVRKEVAIIRFAGLRTLLPPLAANPLGMFSIASKGAIVQPAPGGITLPYWLLLSFIAGITIVPWLRWRFSLRTLLITTTLVAVLLGLFVWLR
jgi:hypothetical protein